MSMLLFAMFGVGQLGHIGLLNYLPGSGGGPPPTTFYLTNDSGSNILTNDNGTQRLTSQ